MTSSPIDSFYNGQSKTPNQMSNNNFHSSVTHHNLSGFKTTEFPAYPNQNMHSLKIDHTCIIENYKQLRLQQRERLAELRMPAEMKQKLFGFEKGQKMKYEKPDLVIFNHPFRGKMVMTREAVAKELESQRKTAKKAAGSKEPYDQDTDGVNIDERYLNPYARPGQEIKVMRMKNEKAEEKTDNKYSNADKGYINGNVQLKSRDGDKSRLQKELDKNQLIFVGKNFKGQEGLHNQENSVSKQNSRNVDDIPIIGEEPQITRDLTINQHELKHSGRSSLYRRFGNQSQIVEIPKNESIPMSHMKSQKSKQKQKPAVHTSKPKNTSLSEISAINDRSESADSLSQSSLNKALFQK